MIDALVILYVACFLLGALSGVSICTAAAVLILLKKKL